MKLTSPEEAAEFVLHGYDRRYYDRLYSRMRYAYTGNAETYTSRSHGSIQQIPIYPDIANDEIEVGKSRRMLQNSRVALSRLMNRDPEPEFPQVDPVTAEVRKQFYLARYAGDMTSDGSWGDPHAQAFMDGDSLGVGCVQFGAVTDQMSGEQKVGCQAVSPLQIVWDRNVPHPTRARWVCLIHHMAPEEARKRFGQKLVNKHIIQAEDHISDRGFSIVRVFEFFSTGIGKQGPTYICRIGTFDGDVAERSENPYGPVIPCAWMINFVPSGHSRPIGRFAMQEATQLFISEIEQAMLDQLRAGSAIDLIDPDAIDPEDMSRFLQGDRLAFLRLTKALKEQPFWRIPEKDLPDVIMPFLQYAEAQLQADSNFSELDRNGMLSQQRTATEVAEVGSRTTLNQAWDQRQTALFLRRSVERALRVASVIDRAPVELDIFGRNVTINQPAEPNSWIDAFLSERSSVMIAPDSLTADDDRFKKELAIRQVMRWFELGLVGQTIDPAYATEKLLKLTGEPDINRAMMVGRQQATAPEASAMAAMPDQAALAAGQMGLTMPMGLG